MTVSNYSEALTVPEAVFAAIARATEASSVLAVDGFDVRAMSGHRGETRVWRVWRVNPPTCWYVKRLREPRIYRRYLEGLQCLERIVADGSNILPAQWAGQDEAHLLVATRAVEGSSATSRFVRAVRFDKLFFWRCSDLDGLARQLGRGLRALWDHTCTSNPALFDYTPQGTTARILQKCDRLREVLPQLWQRFHRGVNRVAEQLKETPCPQRSFLLGDVNLSNLLLSGPYVGVFDLDDIGVGDWRRDVSCLVQRLTEAEERRFYSQRRVRRFGRLFLEAVGLEPNDRVMGMYRVEFFLDMLWSSVRHTADRSLPILGFSIRNVERLMDKHLDRLARA